MASLTKYFLRGTLVLIPLLVTGYVIWLVATTMGPLVKWVGDAVGGPAVSDVMQYVLGTLVTLAGVTLLGRFASNYLGAKLITWLEQLVEKVPLVKLLHGSVRDLLGAFVGDEKSFDRPVMVRLDGGAAVVGFVTRDDLSFLGATDHVAVYLPQSYNFAGNLIVVPGDRVQSLDAPSSAVMAFLVSGGVSAKKEDAAGKATAS